MIIALKGLFWSVNLLLLNSLLDLHVDQWKRYFLPLVLLGHFSIWCIFVFEHVDTGGGDLGQVALGTEELGWRNALEVPAL